jgi:putative PEP-CTERM system histidine kinase
VITFSLLPFGSAVCGGILAIGMLLRKRRSVADWAFAAGMAVLASESVCSGFSIRATSMEEIVRWQQRQLLVLSLLPGVWLLFSLTYARGKPGTFLIKWRLPLAGAFLLPVGISLGFRTGLVTTLHQAAESGHWILLLGWPGFASHLLVLIGSVLVLMNLERTFRASVGTMRWRIKFMLLGVGVLFVVRIYTSSQVLLFHRVDLSLASLDSAALLVAAMLIPSSFIRARHFDLDVHPSQSVLQNSVTVLLAGIYLLIVGVLAKAVAYFGGDAAFAIQAFVVLVSLVLLAILLQSDRMRLHLRRFVSRNFQRPVYDYRTVWQKFNEGTASHLDQGDLCRSLVKLAADMFQVLSVSIWLVDEKKETLTLAASTSLAEAKGREIGPQKAEAGEVIGYFQNHPEPVEIESKKTNWAALLRRWHPREFHNGGNRICLPIISHGEVLGLMTLGDRVGGTVFSLQDFDMLKCVGDHTAASLFNAQLSQKLLQAREFEAFQTMAAFFVHDLKNAASTLKLMLQNLPVHFDDPEFREDVLRGISKTVIHIDNLIVRLSLLRHELKIQPAETDLNEVIVTAIAGLESSGSVLIKDLNSLPKILIDREQMTKVVTNLVLNATEAVAREGEVRIATAQNNGWAVLTVTDNGCGMSAEFVNRSLFRPFQTTKKSGLGIGMFQSMMIVKAHGGRIAVASEPGKGTAFQVFLPAPPAGENHASDLPR